ncbi:MAG TPA: metallophosphoesterase [Hyphomicrobiaceae bacterium]|nr:metallophosphoesterase [Hyphomicrobiaceae bacterium]
MRLHIFSDLHADIAAIKPIVFRPDADVAVVAGDVCENMRLGLPLLRRIIPAPMPIVFVAGNHEFYNLHFETHLARGRAIANELGITLLENETAVIAGVRFIGATLWTDYDLNGIERRARSMEIAAHSLNDHGAIRCGPEERLFTPADARELHLLSRAYLEAELGERHTGPTVVVTHHLPHPGSIHRAYAGHAVNPAFATDLSELIARTEPELWVHGHTHASADHRVGRTRIVCNPHGYRRENPAFDPGLIIEI